MSALLLWLGTGVGAGTLLTLLTQTAIHHHTEITGVTAAVLLWLVTHTPSRRLQTLCAPHEGRHAGARKTGARQAAAGRHETTESQVTA